MGETPISTIAKRGERGNGRPWARIVEDLYRSEFAGLCRMARRYLDTMQAAEDAVQEAFVRFSALSSRPVDGCELAYLRSIVMNEAKSTLRHRLVGQRHAPALCAVPELDRTLDETVRRDQARELRAAVGALPLRQRQVVTLRHLDGLSERETATKLAISAGSVKTHCSRGLASVRLTIGQVA